MPDAPLIRSLREGDAFVGYLLALEAAFKTSTRGSEYLELRLGDASGDLKAFLWDVRAVEGDMDLVKADAFLKVKGRVDAYNGRVQLKLDKVRFATDEEVGDLSRFFPVSPRPVPEMLALRKPNRTKWSAATSKRRSRRVVMNEPLGSARPGSRGAPG